MNHPLNGQCYRYSFIFSKSNLTEELTKEINDYLSVYCKEENEFERDGVITGCSFRAYETVFMEQEERIMVTPVYIIVFFGNDWINFIQDILDFAEVFPKSKIPREGSYSYTLKDENREFDDFK
jgi:hypothetical protein